MNTIAKTAKKLFRIQYVSDLHLEHYEKLAFPLVIKPAARYLALAGDIGRPGTELYRSFIDYTARNWDRVFLVAGNHEYYAPQPAATPPQHLFEIQETINAVARPYKNVHFLHHDSASVYLAEENVAVIGSTLWTNIPTRMFEAAGRGINDYAYISFQEGTALRQLMPQDTNAMHAEELAMLEAQINYWGSQHAQVCVITHHMPSYSLISPRYAGDPLNCCFASRCDALFKPHVRGWIYGHTHNAATAVINNTICVVNARGYMRETVPGFSREAWLEFPTKFSDDTECGSDDLAAAAAGIRSPLSKMPSGALAQSDEEIVFM